MSVIDIDSLRKFKKDTNFFETPDVLADRMAALVDDVGCHARILEPSAGRGALVKAVNKAIKYHIAPVEVCEPEIAFVQSLKSMGCSVVGGDFLKYAPGPVYHAILMNPPYKNKAAEKHVNHAWDCIRPGGKIVALVGAMAASWIDEEFCGHVFEREEIKGGTFKETNIKTVLFLIHKPLDGRTNNAGEAHLDLLEQMDLALL